MATQRSTVVVGAGISGLVAARRLRQRGFGVTLLEASARVGGQIESREVAEGVWLDLGAESLHLSAPGVAALVDELGLTDSVVTATPGSSRLATRRGLRPLPAGVGPAGPSRLAPVLTSRTLTLPQLVRAGLEPVASRRTTPLSPDADVSVGDFVTSRFGRAISDTFVDPLLGTLHAGDVSRLSLRACAPMLVPSASSGRSLLRKRAKGAAVQFATWRQGLGAVADALLATPGLEVRTGCRVTGIEPTAGGGHLLHTDGPGTLAADAVVVAVPADAAATLLGGVAPGAYGPLTAVETADVVTVLVAVPAGAARRHLHGTGLMVGSGSGRLLKAATFSSAKWPHLADDREQWLRLSAGRVGDDRIAGLDDDQLVAALMRDLRELTGLDIAPTRTVVRRWPGALPQLTVGHAQRIAAARAALPPGIALAGAAYDGLGLAACVRSGATAADQISQENP
ncbi:protoporphyrinogen oxidase [Nocardioides sp. Y6]|uniref:Coproporphyrinogen III oxidase n=1 Tax=Nocardioides malaquae TaxID=2773426 RepID=A0ABR9RSH0_9ACTN|nr:protoporphyrinogen oxidase [Nocardioides malaquae]MBE7324519.1 protoporphyrinogen oxidase [Nocardioides malaquae]